MYVATMPASVAFPGVVRSGLGDAASASRNVQVIGSIASAGSVGLLATFGLSTLVPIVGPLLGAAVMGIQYLVANSGCGQTCVVTSQWANQAAAQLQRVLDSYFAIPAPRTDSQKNAAVTAFNAVWDTLQQQCGQPGTGDAGKRCISDRQAGACTWKQKYAPVYPGEPAIGECWNWFNGYLQPIQQDVTVPDPVDSAVNSAVSSVESIFSGGSSDLMPLLVIGGLLALGVAL